jgi:hypothetical protein
MPHTKPLFHRAATSVTHADRGCATCSQHDNLPKPGIDEIRQGEIDQAVITTKRHGRFCAVCGEWHEALAFSTGKNNAKDLLRCHGLTVGDGWRRLSPRTALACEL